MIILGITGAIGHGKSTLAEYLAKHEPRSIHLESYKVIAEVADALHSELDTVPKAGDFDALNRWLAKLPAIINAVTRTKVPSDSIHVSRADLASNPYMYQKLFEHLDSLQSNPNLKNQKITDKNKTPYRPILQWLGGFLTTKVDDKMWYRELVRRAQESEKQGKTLAIIGGVRFPSDASVIKDAGGSIVKIVRPEAPEPDLSDPTERDREHIATDITVINNATLAGLNKITLRLLRDIQSGTPDSEYKASDAMLYSSK